VIVPTTSGKRRPHPQHIASLGIGPSFDEQRRSALPAESRTYELLQVLPDSTLPGVTNLFRFDELRAKAQAASDGKHDIPYEHINATDLQLDHPYRRLIERVRSLFRPNDLGASVGDSTAFRTIRGFPSASKLVTRMFHPAGILQSKDSALPSGRCRNGSHQLI
jgi:hypothetical protein